MIQNFRKGFSLVELLVVIAIIGILAAVGITAYSGYTNSAKEKATLANHAQLVAAINSEFAKCAAGSGNFVWGGACNQAAVASNIVDHFGQDDGMADNGLELEMTNPYNRNTYQVSLNNDAMAWDGTDMEHNENLGTTAVNCSGEGCTVATNPGENGEAAAADVFVEIQTY